MRFKTLIATTAAVGIAVLPAFTMAANAATPTGVTCNGVSATIVSSSATITGTSGNDVIVVQGDTSTHTIDAGAGNDTVCDSNAADIIKGGTGNDTILGNGGNDTITDPSGTNTIDAGSGNDLVTGGANNDTVTGGTGNDTIASGAGNDTVNGGDGTDTIDAGAGTDVVNSGAGDDKINAGTGNDTVNAGDGNDTVDAGAGDDVVNAGTGADTVTAGDGVDTINGGTGNDTLNGSAGNDTLNGEDGTDVLNGGTGNDSLNGGTGNDTLNGEDGDDSLDGNDGTDTINGGTGSDVKHLDSGDKNKDATDKKDTKSDDSSHKVVDATVTTDLTAAAAFVNTLVQAGVLTGTGTIAGLPVDPAGVLIAPVTTLVKTVTWKVSSPSKGQFCIDATTAAGQNFKYRSGEQNLAQGRVTTGTCSFDYKAPAVTNDIKSALNDAAAYLVDTLRAGGLPATGDQATLPDNTSGATVPSGALIKRVIWSVSTGKSFEAKYTIVASADGVSFFRLEGEASTKKISNEIKAGQPNVEKPKGHGSND